MSTIQNSQASWTSLAGQQLDSKYEKCRNITEEIYKRINITFQIKKLETGEQSDISVNSDQIDSNELSNETDLFACDKSDISSSTEAERNVAPISLPPAAFINNNNNEEKKKATVYKRPRKRFRKRVKKRPTRKRSDSEGSSDEAPLSRSLLILSPDLKQKSPEKEPTKKGGVKEVQVLASKDLTLRELLKPDDIKVPTVLLEKNESIDHEAVKQSETTQKNTEPVATERNYRESSVILNKEETSSSVTDDKTDKDQAIDKKNVEVGEKRGQPLSMAEEKKKSSKDVKVTDWKNCSLCSLSFRGERGLRRHMSMSHIVSPEGNK